MANPMAPLLQIDAELREDSLVELSPHARLPRLDLGIDWGSRSEEFRTSLATVVSGPPTPKNWETARNRVLRVQWVEGPVPGKAFTASSLWHIAIIFLATLPIWGFLPSHSPNLAPVQIELTWYDPTDLPPISLPARVPKPAASHTKPAEAPKRASDQGADSFHPRQTILSIPVRVTHPRQTLIRPDAPNSPPKIVPQMPNIVQWSAPQIAKPKFQLSPTSAAPKVKERAAREVVAPEVVNNQKTPGPINIAPTPVTIARPQIPLSAMSAPKTPEHASADAAAPEISAGPASESAQRNILALSANPGPPMPVTNVPEGNLAARISISPAGMKPGEPTAAANHGGASGAANGSGAASDSANAGGPEGAGSFPAAISVSGGVSPHTTGGGQIGGGANRSGQLNLNPTMAYQPARNPRRGPIDPTALAPGLPAEKILSGEVFTSHIDRPNLTSATGSWILSYAELYEGQAPAYMHRDPLAAPKPLRMTDPKYPPELIKGHVQGEVVLYAIIRKDGSIDSIQIVRHLDPQLDRNAIDAFKQWTFEPATRDKLPVDTEVVIHIPFRYQDPREYPAR